eukprot:Transcript_21967.p1 GENE.Transcript_21967~~Transcript_21967.p1  ORF type:complete len:562 (-),score=158.88 Transcript_21967:999-2684(-)
MSLSGRVPLAAVGVAAGVAAGVALGRWLGGSNAWLRLRLQLGSMTARTVVLANVRVPFTLLPASTRKQLQSDEEGLVTCEVSIAGGAIASVDPVGTATAMAGARIDGCGSVLTACWVDAHTHMVKTHAHPRTRNPTGSISDALCVEMEDQPRWAACPCCRPIAFKGGGSSTAGLDKDDSCVPCPRADDVVRRMDFAVASAYHHGARAVRTHLDGTNAPDAKLRATVYAAFAKCRAKWAARGVEMQGVANLYLPLWSNAALAERHVAEAMQYDGVLIGAYCGNVAHEPEQETSAALDALFGYARKHGLMVDLHIDETNDPACCGLKPLVAALARARAAGYTGQVVLGHCTSLALQPAPTKRHVIEGLAKLGGVTVVCNPTTNLGLQDRRGSAVPHCAPIDPATPRTPLWRGLTLVQELAAAGVAVGAGTDNVRDWWHAYGEYDGLATWKAAVALGHLDTAPNEGAWAHLVSDAPAAALGLAPAAEGGASFARGAPADLVLFPGARRLSELLSRPQTERLVLRRGRVQASRLPSYAELDDLVATPTDLSKAQTTVQRGATVAA